MLLSQGLNDCVFFVANDAKDDYEMENVEEGRDEFDTRDNDPFVSTDSKIQFSIPRKS
jgi:hypothetical protein